MKRTTLAVVAGVVGLAVGYGAATVANPVDETAVRRAMYKACVNGSGYAGHEMPAQALHCNRENIDRALAIVYGGSHMPPIDPADPRYEGEILRFKDGINRAGAARGHKGEDRVSFFPGPRTHNGNR